MEIELNLKKRSDRSYKIQIGRNNFFSLGKLISEKFSPDKCIIVTDTKIDKLYKSKIKSGLLSNKNFKTHLIKIPSGDKSKSQKVRDLLEREVILQHPTRNTILIALGGGVVGDITGLLASTILRGIKYVQVPTTIIAQVDSSIGGKTGINLPESKNMIGTIHQPSFVLIDIDFIKTLPVVEYLNGLAEIIKSSVIASNNLFRFLEDNFEKLLMRDPEVLQYCIEKCVRIKSGIVQQDETENGLRKILNFGHTIGHAIEAFSNYRVKHGFAVAEGMIVESRIANQMKILQASEFGRIAELISNLGLDKKFRSRYKFNLIWEKILFDKKKVKDKIVFSLPSKIGKCEFNIVVNKPIVKSAFEN